MESLRNKLPGILVCLVIAIPSYLLGKFLPVVGGAIFSILIGMVITTFWKEKGKAAPGIKFTSKFVLQLAVVLLGFGLNLNVIMQTGKQSLPIIIWICLKKVGQLPSFRRCGQEMRLSLRLSRP